MWVPCVAIVMGCAQPAGRQVGLGFERKAAV